MIVEPASPDLAATIAALRRAPADIRDAINQGVATAMLPAWQEELGNSTPANGAQGRILTEGAKAASYTSGFAIAAGTSRKPLSGGLVPAKYARAFEFGTDIAKHTPFKQRSRKGNWYTVAGGRKHTNAQMPPRSRTGWVVYPAATRITKRAFQLFTQTVVRGFHDAIDRIN